MQVVGLLPCPALALYPQTTCFYKAIVTGVPTRHEAEYEVTFEDHVSEAILIL